MTDLSETIIQHFSAMFPLENKQAQIAMTTVLLNYAVVYTSRKISKESQNIVMSLCLLFMQGSVMTVVENHSGAGGIQYIFTPK